MPESKIDVYDDACVEIDTEGSLESARAIVPIVVELVSPKSVIDFGCGRGAWLKAFHENGVEAIEGLDGPWVDQAKLLINQNHFRAVDLRQPFEINGRFDLAVCLEVAEHLPPKASTGLVRALTLAAPLVLFSAAVPGQTGTCHVNEQWPGYWKSLFAKEGFSRFDPIRPRIWQDSRVAWWYQQNIFLCASSEAISKSMLLQEEEQRGCNSQLTLIHERILQGTIAHYTSLTGLLQELPHAAWRATKRRLFSSS